MIFLWGDFLIIVWCHLSAVLLLIQHCLWTRLREAIMCRFGRGMGEDSCGCGRPDHPHSSSQHLGYLSLQWEVHRCPAYDLFEGCQLKPPESWFVVGFARHWTSILMSDKDIYSILFICTPDVEHATWRLVPGKVGISWILSFTLSFTCSMLFFGSVVLQMTLFLDPTHLVQAAWPEQWTRMNACNWVGVWR